MQCPNCGSILVSTATVCNRCNTPVKPANAPKPVKKSIFAKIVAVFLFLVAAVGVFFSMKPSVCLTGTWQRNFQTEQAGVLVRQEYSFNPVGVMSRDLGNQRERGRYELQDGYFVFTQTNADASETIPYSVSVFGKLTINGEIPYPYTIVGLSLSHTLLLISIGLVGLGVYLFLKRPKLKLEDDEDEDEIEYEVYEEDEEDEEEIVPVVPNPPPPRRRPEDYPLIMGHRVGPRDQFVNVDPLDPGRGVVPQKPNPPPPPRRPKDYPLMGRPAGPRDQFVNVDPLDPGRGVVPQKPNPPPPAKADNEHFQQAGDL